ncbi:hypothetical protein [Ornithinimicrobium kibberense]|uniref:hypothetical protein n=1 Tax=Ornithinimicrobium kibberense TaxID=282060 RepID=UPI00362247FA
MQDEDRHQPPGAEQPRQGRRPGEGEQMAHLVAAVGALRPGDRCGVEPDHLDGEHDEQGDPAQQPDRVLGRSPARCAQEPSPARRSRAACSTARATAVVAAVLNTLGMM